MELLKIKGSLELIKSEVNSLMEQDVDRVVEAGGVDSVRLLVRLYLMFGGVL
jgi:hypothetical protein